PFVSLAEWIGARLVGGVVAATPVIAGRFPRHKTVLVRNFPILEELHAPSRTSMRDRPLEFTYIGTIAEVRNIYAMIEAVTHVRPQAHLRLAGEFANADTKSRAMAMPEWSSTRFDGWTSREG